MTKRSDYSKHDAESGELVHDERGYEIPDPTPMAPPIGYNRQPSLAEQIRAMIVSQKLAQEAAEAGAETFEEADDFEIGDDFEQERHSPYEANFDPMTDQERAALTTQGKDPDKILTPAEKASLSPKPAKKKSPPDQGGTGIGSASDDQSDEGA